MQKRLFGSYFCPQKDPVAPRSLWFFSRLYQHKLCELTVRLQKPHMSLKWTLLNVFSAALTWSSLSVNVLPDEAACYLTNSLTKICLFVSFTWNLNREIWKIPRWVLILMTSLSNFHMCVFRVWLHRSDVIKNSLNLFLTVWNRLTSYRESQVQTHLPAFWRSVWCVKE